MICCESNRLGEFRATVDAVADALDADPGSEAFDARLADFCKESGLAFDPIDQALAFRRA